MSSPVTTWTPTSTETEMIIPGIGELKTPLVLIRGVDDPGKPAEYELEIHQAVPGSRYIKLDQAGHFPMAERPGDVNRALEELMAEN